MHIIAIKIIFNPSLIGFLNTHNHSGGAKSFWSLFPSPIRIMQRSEKICNSVSPGATVSNWRVACTVWCDLDLLWYHYDIRYVGLLVRSNLCYDSLVLKWVESNRKLWLFSKLSRKLNQNEISKSGRPVFTVHASTTLLLNFFSYFKY